MSAIIAPALGAAQADSRGENGRGARSDDGAGNARAAAGAADPAKAPKDLVRSAPSDGSDLMAGLDRLNRAARAALPAAATTHASDYAERLKLYEAECARFPKAVHIFLKDDRYYNIDRNAAGKMLGYFTSKLQADGFPWELKKTVHWGPFTRHPEVSEMEALQLLERGDEVLLQPKRIIDLSINPDGLAALAMLTTPVAPVAPAAAATALSKTNLKSDGAGREVDFGKAITIHSFGELKLLYEMYNPDAKLGQSDQLGEISKRVSFFAGKMRTTNYPWAFYESSPGSRISNTVRSGLQGALVGGLIGGIAGLAIAATSAGKIPYLSSVLGGAQLGAVGYGLYQAVGQLFSPRPTVELNTLEAVDRLNRGRSVIFQKRKMHNVSFAIIKWTWFTDYGVGSEIHNKEELGTFYDMQNQFQDPSSNKLFPWG